ncbi:MAG: spore maturation protein B, partial [Faecalibacillus intestinalis]|nr:spore maturation protein B [Faecalibacillus intestinalis]
MSNLILLIILWSFLECAYKKIPIYEEFITGVKEGMHYLMILFPSIMLLTLWVNLFLSSGFISLIGTFFIRFFSIPLDLLLMAFTRPISSQTSLIILKRIYDHYGID